jgi:hypothetical protein
MSYELNEYEIREKENAKEVVDHLSRFVNSMGRNPKYFVDAVKCEHRTLQQSMFNVFLACIEGWANLPEGWYDLRNEYTVMNSRKIIKALEGNIHAPLI